MSRRWNINLLHWKSLSLSLSSFVNISFKQGRNFVNTYQRVQHYKCKAYSVFQYCSVLNMTMYHNQVNFLVYKWQSMLLHWQWMKPILRMFHHCPMYLMSNEMSDQLMVQHRLHNVSVSVHYVKHHIVIFVPVYSLVQLKLNKINK